MMNLFPTQVWPNPNTKERTVLNVLLAARGRRVPLPVLARHSRSHSVCTCVNNLRERGFRIKNTISTLSNGEKRSWYRLILPRKEGRD